MAELLYPSDFTYDGAMRMPAEIGADGLTKWSNPTPYTGLGWDAISGSFLMVARTSSSLYKVAGITPAIPVISATKNVAELNTATTTLTKEFTDITGGAQADAGLLTDVEYIPAQPGQTVGHYVYTRFVYYSVSDNYDARHIGWADTDFTAPNAQNGWDLDGLSTRNYDKYLTKIPDSWATSTLGHTAMGIGRVRTNASFGPGLYAFAPWIDNAGAPPLDGANLAHTLLLSYPSDHAMESFGTNGNIGDAVWVSYGGKEALIFYGTIPYRYDSGCANCSVTGAIKWWKSTGTGRSTGYKDLDAEQTYLSADITAEQNTVPVTDASIFANSGRANIIYISGVTPLLNEEEIRYTGKSGNTLTGVTRGVGSYFNAPLPHSGGAKIVQVMPDVMDYGGHTGGYDSIIHIPALLFYDPADLAAVAAGTKQSWEPQPYAYLTLDRNFYQSGANKPQTYYGNMFGNGITTDGDGHIFIGEEAGDPGTYTSRPLIHQFSIGSTGIADTTPPDAPESVAVNSSGVLTWGASNEDVTYVIFKYFTNPHVSVPVGEYRPIRTSLATTWTDPLYQAGDKYQIIAHDRSMNASSGTTTGNQPPLPSGVRFGSGGSISITPALTAGASIGVVQ